MANSTFRRRVWIIPLVMLACIVTISCGQSTDKPPVAITSPDIQIGDQGYLDDGTKDVVVARTQDAENKFTNAAIAHDLVAGHQLEDNGDIFFVSKGTKVKLIGYGDGMMGADVSHLRFIGGARADQEGWIASEMVKKQGSNP